MKAMTLIAALAGYLLAAAVVEAAGDYTTLNYGTIQSVGVVQQEGSRGGGTLIGGVAGAVIADDHPGLGALAGGLLGGTIQKHHTQGTLVRYSIALVGGGGVVIDTEQEDLRIGDCVVVEQGQYANIRRVSSVNCQAPQPQPQQHHVDAANNCQLAKDELNNAKTDDAVNIAVTKVRALCED